MGREWLWVGVQVRFDRAGHGRGMFGIKVGGAVMSQLQILGTSCALTELLD